MPRITCQSIHALLDDVLRAFIHTGRIGLRALRRMSWPALLLSSVLLALLLTILPLALCLFAFLLLLKLAVGAVLLGSRRARRDDKPRP
ncbi:hypothetical protein ACFOLJ_03765 [Rugamonas sp. CCM 8940]|uniref:hypothetical protein n=1 Tax=Rugamonas sp. CCM 8940 TaxID=2765359 RepID=UPI0018F4DFC8|nr:hypothetical protein [Rugamonas sp. CCM 8940]MBJ7309703.1 hypothetical protein [Rugamonas sp. CCM 8940]